MENQRTELGHSVKIKILENELEHIKDDIEVINKTLYNDGQGMVFDVREIKHNYKSSAGRASAIINVFSVLISFIVMILMILEKMK